MCSHEKAIIKLLCIDWIPSTQYFNCWASHKFILVLIFLLQDWEIIRFFGIPFYCFCDNRDCKCNFFHICWPMTKIHGLRPHYRSMLEIVNLLVSDTITGQKKSSDNLLVVCLSWLDIAKYTLYVFNVFIGLEID